ENTLGPPESTRPETPEPGAPAAATAAASSPLKAGSRALTGGRARRSSRIGPWSMVSTRLVISWAGAGGFARGITIMRMNRLVLLLLLAVAAPAVASDACMPVASDGWIRKPPVNLPVMAGYAKLENPCDAAATIVAASSEAFADT